MKTNLEMLMQIQYKTENHRDAKHINSLRMAPSSFKGFNGLYKFPLGVKFPLLFQKAGAYTFSFSTVSNSRDLFFLLLSLYNTICFEASSGHAI